MSIAMWIFLAFYLLRFICGKLTGTLHQHLNVYSNNSRSSSLKLSTLNTLSGVPPIASSIVSFTLPATCADDEGSMRARVSENRGEEEEVLHTVV